MAEYEELIEALRHCYEDDDACATCQRWLADDEWGIKCKGRLISDAAAAIEELMKNLDMASQELSWTISYAMHLMRDIDELHDMVNEVYYDEL